MNIKLLSIVLLVVLFIAFSALGFVAMKPKSSQKNIDAFWIAIIAFHVLLAAFLYFFVSRVVAIAPIIPAFIFAKLFKATRKPKNSASDDEK